MPPSEDVTKGVTKKTHARQHGLHPCHWPLVLFFSVPVFYVSFYHDDMSSFLLRFFNSFPISAALPPFCCSWLLHSSKYKYKHIERGKAGAGS